MANCGMVLTREVIMERVWGTDFEGESRTLDMHIKTLRQKLGEEVDDPHSAKCRIFVGKRIKDCILKKCV